MKPASIWDWLGPLAIIAIFVAYLFTTSASEGSLCDGANCFREWVAALSGWAALGAAIVTLCVMHKQLEDQRRQTDYITGDMPPEMTAEATASEDVDDWYTTLHITITNRNRRPVRVGAVTFVGDERITIGVYSSAANNNVQEKIFSKSFPTTSVNRVLIGREDGVAAPQCTVDCHVFWQGKVSALSNNPDEWSEFSGKLTVDAYVKGESERLVKLDQYVVFDL